VPQACWAKPKMGLALETLVSSKHICSIELKMASGDSKAKTPISNILTLKTLDF
jgi:hypothetical protein